MIFTMKSLLKILVILIIITPYISPLVTARPQPVEDDTLRVARATWDTGWFQTEVFRLLAEEMGYTVNPAVTMTADEFYEAAANGKMDFWVNGWFPLHKEVIKANSRNDRVEPIGYEVQRGALQGYLVDMNSAERYGIESLEQLKDPEIARIFDQNGNGKADLIGCNRDWSCYSRINDHIRQLGLEETLEQISGDYNPMVREAIEKQKDGEAMLIYTWTPNWTLGEVIPGVDVLWLHVPVDGQQSIQELEGASRNPINMGYDLNDIRVVANRQFLKNHSGLRTLFENVKIPLDDIQKQNAEMAEGAGSLEEIRSAAKRWIEDNRYQLTQILTEAGVQNPFEDTISGGMYPDLLGDRNRGQQIRVVTQQVKPLVQYQNRNYSGFSIEIFKSIADDMGLDYSIYSVNSIAKMLDDVKRGEADIATAAIGITSDREEILEFTHPYYETGLQIMIPKQESSINTIPLALFSIIFSRELMLIFIFFFSVLVLSAHIIWVSERKTNEDFPDSYWHGIGVAIWWAAVTVTTVGYGDKTPKGMPGRIFGLIWIFAGYFAFSYFTATITSTVTLQEFESNIQNMDDLYGKNVATVSNSAAEYYLTDNGIQPETFNTIEQTIDELLTGDTDAIVYDAPVLQHYASEEGYGKVSVTGSLFQRQSYGFALPKGSHLRKEFNLGYLRLVENGEYKQKRQEWFGK